MLKISIFNPYGLLSQRGVLPGKIAVIFSLFMFPPLGFWRSLKEELDCDPPYVSVRVGGCHESSNFGAKIFSNFLLWGI